MLWKQAGSDAIPLMVAVPVCVAVAREQYALPYEMITLLFLQYIASNEAQKVNTLIHFSLTLRVKLIP